MSNNGKRNSEPRKKSAMSKQVDDAWRDFYQDMVDAAEKLVRSEGK